MNRELLAPRTVLQDRYELVALLRETSLVVTYKGRQIDGGRPIVLKLVRLVPYGGSADMARRYGTRFLREMHVCARLQHPSIARPIDFGRADEGHLYAVFEFVPGRSLAELLSERGALDPPEARRLMLRVLGALDCAHRQGIVHGDLRPPHVMMVSAGAPGDALVLDFGFGAVAASARAANDSGLARSSEELRGWQDYAAPEQLRGSPPTGRSDLYAWGIVFLECLTGRRSTPGGSSGTGIVLRDGRELARFPDALLDHPLGGILRRATVEDVARREVTADGLLRELDTCEVDGLRREDLIDSGAPSGAGARGEEGRGVQQQGNPGVGPPEPQQEGRSISAAFSIEDPAHTFLVTRTALVDPMPDDPALGAATGPLKATEATVESIVDAAPVAVGSRIKHYEIIRKLGQGGMGVVFLARDTRLGRLVAIKLLLKLSGGGIKRFLAEARATARCRHEGIVVIHEVDEILGYPYLVLEYVNGPTLREWMKQRRHPGAPDLSGVHTSLAPMPPAGVAELTIPVVRALVCAHELGIVHRDLKPENILLDDTGCIKVLDFGIAKQIEPRAVAMITEEQAALTRRVRQPRKTSILGTPQYMSPEQLLGKDVDHRTDLWAVGIILHELLTGKHPLDPFSLAQLAGIVDFDVPMPTVRESHPEMGALIDHCLKKRRSERIGSAKELLAELEALLPSRRALALGENESPFAGLFAFQEADAARFFGRDRDITAMMARLGHQQLLAVAGPSGAGKSSFVRAGVIPALKRSGDSWEAFILRPGRRPLSALTDVLVQAADTASATDEPELDHDRLSVTMCSQPGYLGAALRARCRREGREHRVLLFVDQFEELYTLGAAPEDRAAFVACLEGAADDASSPVRVLLAIRSDFLDRMAEDRQFIKDLTRGLWFLPPMGREGLRDALTRPLEAAGYRFEKVEMVEDMLRSLESTPSPLPLLQFAATKLWEARDHGRRLLTQESYHQLGGVPGALSAHADAVFSALPVREQRLARAVFLRLVTPERTRALVSLDELCELVQDSEGNASKAIAAVVQHLADARLLLIETGGEREGTTVELVHESLIDRWGKLGQWLADSQQDARMLARLRAAADQWETSGQAEGLLWRGRAAEDARAWYERRRAAQGADWRIGIGKREERYLLAVVALCEGARRLRWRLATGALTALAAIAVMISYLAVRAERQATRADQEAERARAEALQARNATRMATARELQADPTSVLAIVRELEPPDMPREWAVLAHWALHSRIARVVLIHADAVLFAGFSPDGRRIVTGSYDRNVRVWNADGSGEPLVLRGHEDPVLSAAFSPDGTRIVTGSQDRTARVWNADGSGEPLVLRGHEDRVYSAAFSPDGKRIVTGSWDKTARVWNADGSGEPLVLRGHEGWVYSAAFSPDGKRIVTGSQDRTVRVWNADGSGEPLVLRGHEDRVYSAAFSPDGERVVTGSWDKTARVWNADGSGEPLVLRGHENWVQSVAFSPDGKRIVTGSWDKTARVWNSDGSGDPIILGGHEDCVVSAVFDGDGKRVVTGSQDKTARVWNTDGSDDPLVLRGHRALVWGVAFSPDGKRIVSASEDKTMRVWNADGSGEPLVLRAHQGGVYSAAFSPDGTRIVAASDDATARVWNADGTGEPLVLRGHEGWVYSAAFSPDGERVVTGSQDKTARVWNADGTGEPLVLRGHEDRIYSVAFSPDGKRVVTGSQDKTARVWNADGTGEPLVLRGHEDRVYSVAFSSDGKRIVTGSWDKTARVWNADGTGEPLVLRGHKHWIMAAAFSPDGKRIVTGAQDQTIRVWNADGAGEPLILRGANSAINSVAFSADGKRIVSASDDAAVRVWTDLEPLRGVDDPKLWTATTYCMPIEARTELLRMPEAMARAGREACLRHVEETRAAAL
ncbi:protein kinase [Sorangium sp. So ce295]|uniref:nSTAND1 domain-containing NTPase n=1 Tax=Sorangium sp. So ce295 TaxID=3133295 RepID=UPI003F623273